jgi:hypothetical protein
VYEGLGLAAGGQNGGPVTLSFVSDFSVDVAVPERPQVP